MEEWMQYARDMAKAEKELEIELWVIISFYRTTGMGCKDQICPCIKTRKVAKSCSSDMTCHEKWRTNMTGSSGGEGQN